MDVRCDVCVVGSGAGGAVLAAGLAEAGLDVVMLEEGGFHTKRDFDGLETTAHPMLYQEQGTRATADLAISILQGRSVGGGTTVNWTTCFRTPERILAHWEAVHGIEGLDAVSLLPHFEAVEERLSIDTWHLPPNAANGALARGCQALGWEHQVLRRNVNGCVNSGYCGMGCPVDGKQGMHLTYLPDAIAAGMTLYADTRAQRLEVEAGRVVAVHGEVLARGQERVTGVKVTVRPQVTVCSGGAINSPALLLRSGLDQGGRVGRRTFLHPVVAVSGLYEERVDGWYGAPQSVGSHHFIDQGADDYGFFLELAPLHPVLAASAARITAEALQDYLSNAAHMAPFIALHVDGLLPGDDGGTVSLRPDGRVRVDYPISDRLVTSFRASHKAMARLHLAAGATGSGSLHLEPVKVDKEADLVRYDTAPMGAMEHAIFTAHQMGGCGMGADPERSVVDNDLRFRGVDNLFVVDGSVLPTALGVNPSETIYAIAHWARSRVLASVGR